MTEEQETKTPSIEDYYGKDLLAKVEYHGGNSLLVFPKYCIEDKKRAPINNREVFPKDGAIVLGDTEAIEKAELFDSNATVNAIMRLPKGDYTNPKYPEESTSKYYTSIGNVTLKPWSDEMMEPQLDEIELIKTAFDILLSPDFSDETRKELTDLIDNEQIDELLSLFEEGANDALADKLERIKKATKQLINLEDDNNELKKDNDRLQKNIDETLKKIQEKVSNLKDDIRSKNGCQVIDAIVMKEVIKAFSENGDDGNVEMPKLPNPRDFNQEELIEAIKAQRPKLQRNDIINYLICLMQGYITTFAGKPGTGKTSLCDILATALGLKKDCTRFIEINVENGWTTYKDYIGYYNSLTKTTEKADADTYDAMYILSHEKSSDEGCLPYVFLLDEANLSPIEYYWSPFLHAADSFREKGTKLPLGGKETWHIPEHVRFLATVNFDHTTEELSPRFLDRSWVITLDPAEPSNPESFPDITGAFSYSDLMKAFGVPKESEKDEKYDENKEVLDTLKEICSNCGFDISQRSYGMMLDYIARACILMDDYAPVDYAFSQKVLPQVKGSEKTAGTLIKLLLGNEYNQEKLDTQLYEELGKTDEKDKNQLKEQLKIIRDEKKLPQIKKILKIMKSMATENYGFYQYFA